MHVVGDIKSRQKRICDAEIGHRSATVCHLGNLARWVSQETQTVGTKLHWDPLIETFKNSDLNNYKLDRLRCKGYERPSIRLPG